MEGVNSEIHKSLLPIGNKSILSHIIDALPTDASIGLLLGHKSEQVTDYLKLLYPNRYFEKIYVDDWESEKAGTFRSIQCAEEFLTGPFWYFPCDGIFKRNLLDLKFNSDHFFVQKVDSIAQSNYTVFTTENNQIKTIIPRGASDENGFVFTGIMYIEDSTKFINDLRKKGVQDFAENISIDSNVFEIDDWIDLGNPDNYTKELNKNQKFDFSKSNEITYIHENTIIKWWSDSNTAKAKEGKPSKFPRLFPNNIKSASNFQVYDKAKGESLYSCVNKSVFEEFLNRMKKEFWQNHNIDISNDVDEFYRNKTLTRYEKARNILEITKINLNKVNGENVADMSMYLNSVDWEKLKLNFVCTPIHGDLQFDNVIYNDEKFTLIDWRPTFGLQNVYGDVYYDFAKLLGGMKLNYLKIKNGEFNLRIERDQVFIHYPMVENYDELFEVFCNFLKVNEFDLDRVKGLVPIIYLNMAPLHSEPFASFLWALSLKEFASLK